MTPFVPALLIACQPGTIDTVQPGAVAKSALDGEWYWRSTIETVPYGTASTFVGAQDDLERIRWEIQEDLLLGYRSYTHVDGDGADDSTTPILAFPILDQFDIRRGYDHTTGEESNVIEENRERPWYDRDYVRVDWSTNEASAPFTFGGLELELLDWVSNDDRAEDAPQFDDSDGDGVIDSLLLTQHALVQPDTEELPGYGDVPVCLFFGQAEYECGPTELGVVQSFVRVDTRTPVLGEVYDDRHMETFGFFSTERIAWDEGYGLVEPNRVRYANRHPLWVQDVATVNGALQCATSARTGDCTSFTHDEHPVPVEIPYREREVRPIVYHAGPNFPPDLAPIMGEVATAWNEPLRDAVNGLRYWECIDAGGEPKACEDGKDPDLQVFVWCPNNPSLASDPPLCSTDHTGPDGHPDGIPDPIRVGDLRYHLADVVTNPQLSSPYGYGPSAADPVGTAIPLADGTQLALGAGEIVQSNAFLYEYVLDRVSHQVADLVQLLNGEISTDAFVAGEDVSQWVDAVNGGDGAAAVGATYGMPETWTSALVAERLGLISNGFSPLIAPYLPTTRPTPSTFDAFLASATDAIDRSGAFGGGAAEADAAFAAVLASPFDELTWVPETIGSYGFDPATSPSALSGRSPLEMLDPIHATDREQWRVIAGQHAVDLDDGAFTDSSLVGLARDYAARGLSYDEIVQDVRLNSFREVMLHEIGHTLGLRHNFSGSFDAFNFRPEYWALRDDGDMGPRHVDPETPRETNGRIHEYQYSTVMDYPGSRNVGWAGLGYYDHAAVKFGYGQLCEVLTDVPEADAIQGLPNVDGISFVSAYASSNVLPSVLLFYTSGAFLDLHYTDYPAMAGDLAARADVPLSRLVPTIGDVGSFADGLVVGEG
ncbi:MAG: zinc-dependent metalloprotease, partial [Myxococcota bacterium]